MDNPSAYSVQIAKNKWPTGASKVFIADAHDTIAIAVAAPAALNQNAPLLLVEPSAPALVLEVIAQLRAREAVLVGPGFSPKSGIRQQINGVTALQQWISGPGPLELDVPISTMFSAPVDELYITDAGHTADLVTASSASSFQKSPLFTIADSLGSWEESELARLKPKRIVFVGNAAAASAALSRVEALGYPTMAVEGASPVERNLKVVNLLRGKNVDTRKFRISVPEEAAAAAPAAYEAALSGTLVRFTDSGASFSGHLADEANAWGIEALDGKIFGASTAIPNTFLASLENAITRQRAPKTSFQVVGSSTGTDAQHTLEMSPYPGAARYRLFDLSGALSTESTTPIFKLPSGQTTFSAKAYNPIGALLAQRDVRVVVADEEKPTATVSAVITSDTEVSIVNWKQQAADARPRTVVRSELVRDSDGRLAMKGRAQIGTTCSTEYIDRGRPVGTEVIYEISQDGTPERNICSTSTPDHSQREESITLSSARVPATNMLSLAQPSLSTTFGTARTNQNVLRPPNAPTPTIAEQALISSRRPPATAGTPQQIRAAASPAPLPWTFRYQTFIPDLYIRPANWDTQVFDGNNRGFGAWLSPYKTRTDVTYYFDQNWRVQSYSFRKFVGITTEYHCSKNTFADCRFVKQAQASDSGISMTASALRGIHVGFINHEVALPIKPHSFIWGLISPPAITYGVHYKYGPGGFTLSGVHDGAPAHEIWGGYVPGEYIPFMLHDRRCGFGNGLLGLCSVGFTIKV